ncbi:hypothetical protein [Bradyrhizobium sp. I1.7.5]|uniref:hypothetical protein n=1 Tax=Bradyrhizobium sp. I1.7.5 TaxID=3156363 RepID=UPI0033989B78
MNYPSSCLFYSSSSPRVTIAGPQRIDEPLTGKVQRASIVYVQHVYGLDRIQVTSREPLLE